MLHALLRWQGSIFDLFFHASAVSLLEDVFQFSRSVEYA